MFRLSSTVEREQMLWQMKYNQLLSEHNELVRRVNALGGEEFLNYATLGESQTFTNAEIKQLLNLCHPDKHAGKQSAVEMTRKLLELRK